MDDSPTHSAAQGCGEIGMSVREMTDTRTPITGITKTDLTEKLIALGMPKFRAKQIWGFIYDRGVRDFDAMHNIAAKDKALLTEHFTLARPTASQALISNDDTRKWLFNYADGNEAETVLIPDPPRGTLCISSQVGCTLSCTFCHTGTQRLVRNLRSAEIVDQVLASKDDLEGEWPTPVQGKAITNIVFMGMGEPLMNYNHVKTACEILTDPEGLQFSRRKVTISTSGVVPKIIQMSDDLGVNLAISLHAVNDDLRDEIVPINKKYPLKELIESCRYYILQHPTRHILIEYVMLHGVNDSDAEAHALVALLKDLPVKVNLIPFNPWPNAPYVCSSNNRMRAFAQILKDARIAAPIRATRGDDILAACGQLKSDSELKKGQKVLLK